MTVQELIDYLSLHPKWAWVVFHNVEGQIEEIRDVVYIKETNVVEIS